MNTFTVQELVDFYQQVADGGEMELDGGYGIGWVTNPAGPDMNSPKDEWRIKPKKKDVDMSVLIESGIDVEAPVMASTWVTVGRLDNISDTGAYNTESGPVSICRPRMNYIHAWQSDGCPLPEGVTVRVWEQIFDNIIVKERTTTSANWPKIVWFEVLGLEDGYCWPYEE